MHQIWFSLMNRLCIRVKQKQTTKQNLWLPPLPHTKTYFFQQKHFRNFRHGCVKHRISMKTVRIPMSGLYQGIERAATNAKQGLMISACKMYSILMWVYDISKQI